MIYLIAVMVNLTGPNGQPARPVGEGGSDRVGSRSHHVWGSRFRRRREEMREEPTGLLQLEELTKKAVELMEKHNPKSESNYTKAMDLLRLQYNLVSVILNTI